MVYYYLAENGGRKGGRQGIDGLCVVTKTNAGKILDVKVWRGEGGGRSHFFGGSSTEIGRWMEECREDGGCEKLLTASELNNIGKET